MVISTLRDGIPVFSSNFVSFFSILFSSSVSSCTFVFVHNRRRRNLSYRKLGFQPNEIPGNGKRYGNRVNRILFYNWKIIFKMEKIQKGVDWLERRKLKFLTVLKIIGRGGGKKKYLACMEKFETIVYYVSFTFFIQRFIYPLRYKILRVYHRAKTAFDLVAI